MNYLSVVVPRSPWTDILRAPQNECATSHTSESSENTQMNCFNLFIASVELSPSPREVTQHSFNEPKALFSLAPWSARMEHSRDPGGCNGGTLLSQEFTPPAPKTAIVNPSAASQQTLLVCSQEQDGKAGFEAQELLPKPSPHAGASPQCVLWGLFCLCSLSHVPFL